MQQIVYVHLDHCGPARETASCQPRSHCDLKWTSARKQSSSSAKALALAFSKSSLSSECWSGLSLAIVDHVPLIWNKPAPKTSPLQVHPTLHGGANEIDLAPGLQAKDIQGICRWLRWFQMKISSFWVVWDTTTWSKPKHLFHQKNENHEVGFGTYWCMCQMPYAKSCQCPSSVLLEQKTSEQTTPTFLL